MSKDTFSFDTTTLFGGGVRQLTITPGNYRKAVVYRQAEVKDMIRGKEFEEEKALYISSVHKIADEIAAINEDESKTADEIADEIDVHYEKLANLKDPEENYEKQIGFMDHNLVALDRSIDFLVDIFKLNDEEKNALLEASVRDITDAGTIISYKLMGIDYQTAVKESDEKEQEEEKGLED